MIAFGILFMIFIMGNAELTGTAELGEEQARPRGQIIGHQSAVTVGDDVGGDDEEAIPGRVDDESEGGIAGQLSLFDERDFFENSGRRVVVVVGDGDLRDAAGEGGDEESAAVWVPLGALEEPAGAVVEEDVGGRFGELLRDEIGDGDGGDQEEEEKGFGGAETRAGHAVWLLLISCKQ